MNEAIFMKLQLELSKLQATGIEIKDVFVLVNLRDYAGNVYGASNIIWSGDNSPLTLTKREKAVLLAEFIKKLGINPTDLIAGE